MGPAEKPVSNLKEGSSLHPCMILSRSENVGGAKDAYLNVLEQYCEEGQIFRHIHTELGLAHVEAGRPH